MFHLRRSDYSRWFRDAIRDSYLADQAERIERRMDLTSSETRVLILSSFVLATPWIKNVCTLLTVQNAYRRDVDVGRLQILDRGVDGLRVRQERCKLVDRSMAELINIGRRTLGHIFSSSGRYFQDTLGRRKSHQCPGSTG
jgi:hypothetical protein